MKRSATETIFRALNEAGTRYLVVGGLAAVAHGHLRFTADIDLVVALERPQNLKRALEALRTLGYVPRLPVQVEDFLDPDIRQHWIEERGLVVFSLVSDKFPATPIDLFASEPFCFETEYAQALWCDLGNDARIPFLQIESLIVMKEQCGREVDRLDVACLRKILATGHKANET